MKIWFDVITPKQARLMASIARYLEERGYETLITSKGYRETRWVLNSLGVRYREVGAYGEDLVSKLINYADRVRELALIVHKEAPDYLVSFSSPEATRVAFGLGIKVINMNDTPHAVHVAKLTFPLTWRLVFSKAIPEELLLSLGASKESLVPYDGVDELAWLKEVEIKEERFDEFTVFVRMEESKASYLLHLQGSPNIRVIERLAELGVRVLAMPRYESQAEFLKGLDVEVLSPGDTVKLFQKVHVVITGGGTMAREAALLGTPAISTFPLDVPLYVNVYLRERGLPVWRIRSPDDVVKKVLELKDNYRDYREVAARVREEMEDPREVICRLLEGV